MIIDEILDYKEGFTKKINLNYIYNEAKLFDFDYITDAIASRKNENIKKAVAKYIAENGYNKKLIDFVQNIIFIK